MRAGPERFGADDETPDADHVRAGPERVDVKHEARDADHVRGALRSGLAARVAAGRAVSGSLPPPGQNVGLRVTFHAHGSAPAAGSSHTGRETRRTRGETRNATMIRTAITPAGL